MQEIMIIMQEAKIRKDFGARIKALRKQKDWSQKELAAKLNIGYSQLNKYECGLHIPPVEKLIQLSEHFDTTVDYLLTGNRSEDRPLHNLRLVERLRALEDFNAEDQDAVIRLIDAMIVKHKVEGVVKPFQKSARSSHG